MITYKNGIGFITPMPDKREIKIKQLGNQKDERQFELNILFTAFFAILALLVAILGIFYDSIGDFLFKIEFIVIILVLIFITYFYFKPAIHQKIADVRKPNKKIDSLYEEL